MIIFVDIDGTICTETPDETIEVALSRKRDENIKCYQLSIFRNLL